MAGIAEFRRCRCNTRRELVQSFLVLIYVLSKNSTGIRLDYNTRYTAVLPAGAEYLPPRHHPPATGQRIF